MGYTKLYPMFLEKLLDAFESFIFSILKITLSIFGIEQDYSTKTGDNLTNSSEALDLYHNDLKPISGKKTAPISEKLWIFILALSFLNFLI